MSEQRLVLFDLDGTLLRGDCVARFLRQQLRTRWWRAGLALLLLTPMLPLFRSWRLAWIPASLASWLASVGRSDAELRAARRAYIDQCIARREHLLIESAVARLHEHRRTGDRVVIVTGAEHSLARELCQGLGLLPDDGELIGSSLRRFLGGWIGRLHCVGPRKLAALAAANAQPPFAVAYTDSEMDLPFLCFAEQPVLVCPSPRAVQRVRRVLPQVECLD